MNLSLNRNWCRERGSGNRTKTILEVKSSLIDATPEHTHSCEDRATSGHLRRQSFTATCMMWQKVHWSLAASFCQRPLVTCRELLYLCDVRDQHRQDSLSMLRYKCIHRPPKTCRQQNTHYIAHACALPPLARVGELDNANARTQDRRGAGAGEKQTRARARAQQDRREANAPKTYTQLRPKTCMWRLLLGTFRVQLVTCPRM